MPTAASEEARAKERVKASIEQAEQIFTEKNLRFTELRRKVFEEIASTQESVGAYEVLDRLARKGTRLAPISVYRALDALLEWCRTSPGEQECLFRKPPAARAQRAPPDVPVV